MTSKELLEILSQGESETIEFKQGRLLIATYGRLITAFLNTKGGKIIIGVKESGEIIGLEEDATERIKRFTIKLALEHIKPKAIATIKEVLIERKRIIIIEVPEGQSKPYGYRGSYFMREGSVIVEMEQQDALAFYGTQEKYDQENISEILEKVKSIEIVLKERIKDKRGTNIFISHGHHPEIRKKVVEFIESLELNPIVVMDYASEGLSVDDKIDKLIKHCAASIILYTPDDQLKNDTFLPRQNVIHETGLLQRVMPDRIIYVKEKNVQLPTNIAPKVYVSFETNNLTDAFIQIVKEFKSLKII